MSELNKIIKEILQSGKAGIVIGYAETPGKIVPYFAQNPEDSDRFIYDERCRQNLATYIHKHEIKKAGKIAVVANIPALRTLLQLAAENQIHEGNIIAIHISTDKKVYTLTSFSEMESIVNRPLPDTATKPRERIHQINNLPREERWDFWTKEFANCIKCYACRSACPLCYCSKCTVEENSPQWVPVESSHQGNLEWHIVRAMHLAGRCISCGECTRACPVEIPVGLLSLMLNEHIDKEFGQKAGFSHKLNYALSSFEAADKENFIR